MRVRQNGLDTGKRKVSVLRSKVAPGGPPPGPNRSRSIGLARTGSQEIRCILFGSRDEQCLVLLALPSARRHMRRIAVSGRKSSEIQSVSKRRAGVLADVVIHLLEVIVTAARQQSHRSYAERYRKCTQREFLQIPSRSFFVIRSRASRARQFTSRGSARSWHRPP
jgi:hypothetical protein